MMHLHRGGDAPPAYRRETIMSKVLTTAEVAERLDTDPRTLRKFLRSGEGFDMKVGKGHRWAIEAKDVRSLKSRFTKWDAARTAPAAEVDENADLPEGDEVIEIDENEVLEVENDA